VAQDDQHLTTEQLSASLDGQVSSEEQTRWDRHLQTCEQCRQGLASLRQTVALLHALPQPALPRSFVLSQESITRYTQSAAHAQDEVAMPTSLEIHRATRQADLVPKQRRRGVAYMRGTLRALSALAAVAGILLFLSGLIAAAPRETTMSTAGSSASSSAGSSSASSSTAQSQNSQPVPATLKATPEPAGADVTPQASNNGNVSDTKASQLTPQLKPAPTAEVRKVLPVTPPLLPEVPFFDINAPSGRIGLGMLLALLGVMGFIVFKQRGRSRSQSQ
jgi:predicted anti-sigma-YlaC factor YlaD